MVLKPSLESLDVPQKFGPDRFSRFDVYWIQTDRQTDKQTNKQKDKPNLYIDSSSELIQDVPINIQFVKLNKSVRV